MTKKELIEGLTQIRDRQENTIHSDYEVNHMDADYLLLNYINDNDVTTIFEDIFKWYS